MARRNQNRASGTSDLNRKRKLGLAALTAGAALLAQQQAHSAVSTETWIGSATGTDWITAANWSGTNKPPQTGDSLIFTTTNASASNTLTNTLTTAAFNIAAITFNAGSPAYTMGGNTFTLTTGIINNSANLQTFSETGGLNTSSATENFNVSSSGGLTLSTGLTNTLAGNQTLSVNGAGGLLTLSAYNLSNSTTARVDIITGTGNVTINSLTSGATASGLSYNGLGTLTLNSAVGNANTGPTSADSGTLLLDFSNMTTPTNLMSSSSALTLGGGTLGIKGKSGTTSAQTFNGAGLTAGTSSYFNFNANGATALNVTLGALTRNAQSTLDITLPSAGAVTTTTTNASNGVLTNAAGVAFATTGGSSWVQNSSGTLSALGSYQTGAANYVATSNVDVQNGDAPASGFTVNTLRFNAAGDVLALSGTNTISTGGILNTAAGIGSNISGGSITSGAAKEMVIVNNGTLNLSTSIGDSTAGASAVTYSGTGTTTINSGNSYTGATSIDQGTVVLNTGSGALGSNSGAALLLGNGNVTLNLNGNSYQVGNVTANYAGGTNSILTSASAATLTVAAGSNLSTLTATGAASILINGGSGTTLGTGAATLIAGTGSLGFQNQTAAVRDNNVSANLGPSGTLLFNGTGQLQTTTAQTTGAGNPIVVNGYGNTWNFQATTTTNSPWTGAGAITISQGFAPTFTFAGNMTGFAGTLYLQAGGTGATNNSATYAFSNSSTGAIGAPNAVVDEQLQLGDASGTTTLQWTGTGSQIIPLGDLNTVNSQGTGTIKLQNATANTTATFQVGALGNSDTYTGEIMNGSSTAITAITKVGNGGWTLTNTASNYSGLTTISAGTVVAAGNAPSGAAGIFGNSTAAIVLGDGGTTTNNASPSLLTGGAFTIARPITVANQATSGTYTIGGSVDTNSAFSGAILLNQNLTVSQVSNSGSNALLITGGISAAAGSPTINFAGPGNISVSGAGVSNGTGTVNITVTGGLTTFAGGSNTYTGSTNISGANFNLSGSIPNTSGVTIGSSGTLRTSIGSGNLAIGGGLTLNGGTLNLNNGATNNISVGGGLSVATSSSISFDINTPGANDDILATGGFSIASGQQLTVNITNLSAASVGTYNLVNYSGGSITGGGSYVLGTVPTIAGDSFSLNNSSGVLSLIISGATAPNLLYWTNRIDTNWNTLSSGNATNWSTAANGLSDPNVLPASNTNVVFAATNATNLNTTLGSDFSIKSLTFAAGTGPVTIGGGNTLTLLGGGITISNSGAADTINASNLSLGASQTWNNSTGNTFTVSSSVGDNLGTSALTINSSGSGAIVLSGSNTYAGGTVLSHGTLSVGNSSALGVGLVTVNGGILDLADQSVTAYGLGGNAGVVENLSGSSTATLNINENGTDTYSGLIRDNAGGTGLVALNMVGTGTAILVGSQTYSGGTTISSGTLQLGDGVANNGTVVGNINDNGTLGIANPTAQALANTVAGSGALVKSGSGLLTIAISNSYSGGTSVNAGTVNATIASALGQGNITVAGGILNANAVGVTSTGSAIVNSGTLNVNAAGAYPGTTTINNGVLNANVTGALQAATTINGGTYTAGAVNSSGTSLAMTMNGGTLDLAGFNTSTGAFASSGSTAIITDSSATAASLTIGAGNGAINLTGIATVSGPTTLVVNGNGAFTSNPAFTYTGPSTGGLTFVNQSLAFGAAPLRVNNLSTNLGANGTLTFGNGGVIGTGFNAGGIPIVFGSTNAVVVTSTTPAGNGMAEWEFQSNTTTNGPWTGAGTIAFVQGFAPTFAFNGDMTGFTGSLYLTASGTTATNNSATYALGDSAAVGAPNAVIDMVLGTGDNLGTNALQWGGTGSATIPIGDLNTNTFTATGYGGAATGTVALQNGVALTTATFQEGALGLSDTFSGNIINGAGTTAINKVGSGTWTLTGSNTYSGPTNVSAGTLVIGSAAALPAGNNVVIGSHSTLVAFSQNTVTSANLIDIGGNLIVHNGSLSAMTLAAQQSINAGWNQTSGIISTAAANDPTHLHALGVIQNDNGTGTSTALYTTFAGQGVVDSDVLVKYTYYGDANLDGKVDGSDYSRIDNAFVADQSTPGSYTGWFNGDFNYDGVVNGSDYTLIDNAFNRQGAQISAQVALPTAELSGNDGTSSVPEPTSLSLLGIGAAGLLGRRRRH